MKEITVTDEEFMDVAGMLYAVLTKNGVITEADMAVAEAEIARKYGIKSISIFR